MSSAARGQSIQPSNLDSSPRRALLVYPEFPANSYWNFKQMHEILMGTNKHGYAKAMMPPLGLLCIAGPIRERYGAGNLRLIDMNVRALTRDDLEWADDIYLSAMLTQAVSFHQVAEEAKAMGKTVIAGGPYVSEDIANVDHLFINESESTLRPFLDALFAGTAERVYSGEKPEAPEFFEPDYSLINTRDYASMAVQFSRGCPHDCEFCDITIRYGRAMRTRDSQTFIGDLERLYAQGWRGQIFIIDDNFIGKPQRALALLRDVAAWQKARGMPFEFFSQATVLLAEEKNEELLLALEPAGFSMIFLGIESPNEESLRETKKHQNLVGGKSLIEKLHRIQEVGKLLILGGFIVGFDNDDADIFARQVEFINAIRLPTPMVALLSPLPGTKLEERLKDEGRLLTGASGAVASGFEVSFEPRNLRADELVEGYKHVLREVYLDMEKFYGRCLQSLGFMKSRRFPFKRDEFFGLFRLLRHEGIVSKDRGHFWKYMWTVVLKHPSKIGFAFRWAAYGLHYRLLTLKMLAEPAAEALPFAAKQGAFQDEHPSLGTTF